MNTPLQLTQPAAANKTLWAVIGVLGLAVLAMGVTLIRQQSAPAEQSPVVALAPSATPAASAPAAVAMAPSAAEPVIDATAAGAPEKIIVSSPSKPPAQVKQAQVAAKPIANETTPTAPEHTTAPTPVKPQNPEPAVARAPAKPVCANCGTVESVMPVERDGAASGVGVVAGGVLGAVVGNQVGGGDGKTLATILGAVGGGLAGNAVEKKMKKVTHYEVTVHMEDGSTRTVVQPTAATVGAHVTVNGNTLHNVTP